MTVIDSGAAHPRSAGKRDLPPSMLERMTLILDSFGGPASRLTLEEVAGRTQLPRSTVHRILDQLVRLNWVEHASFGYRLGRRSMGLGGGDGGHAQVRAAAAPLLHDLHMQTGMVVHLSVLDGGESIYLDKVGGRFAASLPSRVGGRGPAYSTAGGKSMLAWLDPERVDAIYQQRLNRCTDHTIPDLPTLHQELNRIRQRSGLAFERGESVRGAACVGVAVRGYDGPVAAISLCGDARTAQLKRVAPWSCGRSGKSRAPCIPRPVPLAGGAKPLRCRTTRGRQRPWTDCSPCSRGSGCSRFATRDEPIDASGTQKL